MNVIRCLVRLGALATAVSLVGCVTVKSAAPNASPDSVQAIRASGAAPMKAGTFGLAAGKDADMDTTLGGLRGSSMEPASGHFLQDLREDLVADLKAAGLYSDGSDIAIDAQLTDSQVDAAIGTGTGRLAARFQVRRGGKLTFDKEISVDAKWESSFVGGIAIPAAVQQYGALYQALVRQLFADADFRAAVAR